jgi:hypothetical protein
MLDQRSCLSEDEVSSTRVEMVHTVPRWIDNRHFAVSCRTVEVAPRRVPGEVAWFKMLGANRYRYQLLTLGSMTDRRFAASLRMGDQLDRTGQAACQATSPGVVRYSDGLSARLMSCRYTNCAAGQDFSTPRVRTSERCWRRAPDFPNQPSLERLIETSRTRLSSLTRLPKR